MDTLYPSGLENSTTDGPCYTEYTEEEWNDVLTHQPQHPRTDSQPTNKPALSPADCVSSTRPVTMSYTTEIFQKAVGFRNIHPLLKHMTRVSQNTLHVKDLGTYMVRDPGELATLPKSKRNTNPITKPEKFGDVVHFDIVYGLGTAIGGYRYALWLVDRATRYVFEYPLKTLQEDELLKAIQLFRRDCGGRLPSRMIADRDFKLIRGKMAEFLEGINWDADMARAMGQCSVSGAPTGRQNQNGLAEIKWKHVMNMVRNWLTSNYLPKTFWYFALRAAAQVSNYMPIQTDNGVWTTPFELVHQTKLDWRNLIPKFSLSYVKRNRDSTKYRATADSQTIKAICVGNDKKSDGLLFYLPSSKSLISSLDYRLNPNVPSGPIFNLHYDGCIGFDLYTQSSERLRPPAYDVGQTIFSSMDQQQCQGYHQLDRNDCTKTRLSTM
mmetsp:Transcript_21148/g.26890  ORF Transcript_21148/g.26890 Transcript_21148/m.26890 type:complete len:438 (+) Transcript_21148:1038-2351(+)